MVMLIQDSFVLKCSALLIDCELLITTPHERFTQLTWLSGASMSGATNCSMRQEPLTQ